MSSDFNKKVYYAEQITFLEELIAELPARPALSQDAPEELDQPAEVEVEQRRQKLNGLLTFFITEFTDGRRAYLNAGELDGYR